MNTGEWSCLISFAWAPLSCSERRGSEKFKMKLYVTNGIRIHATPRQVNQRFRPLGQDDLMAICGLMSYRRVGYKFIKPLHDNTCRIDYGYMCIWTDCQTKSTFLISMKILANIITVNITLHWLSNHNRFHTCIVTCTFVFTNQDTVTL